VYFNKLKGAVYLSLNALNIHLNHYLSFATTLWSHAHRVGTALFKATGSPYPVGMGPKGGCKGT